MGESLKTSDHTYGRKTEKAFSHGRLFRVFISMMLVVSLVLGTGAAALASSLENEATRKETLSLLKKYDKDGYRIVKTMDHYGESMTEYLSDTDKIDGIDTVVHEFFHAYTGKKGRYNRKTGLWGDRYYLGSGKSRIVYMTPVFKTSVATKHLRGSLRSFRYKEYVSSSSDAASNIDGVYGLLNEFAAYYWGGHAAYSLYPYCRKKAKSEDDWEAWLNCYYNCRDAYAELYFWTLYYLDYARKNNKKVYRQIISNKSYCRTFAFFEKKYARLLRSYRRRIDRVFGADSFIVEYIGSYYTAYGTLMKQISRSRYRTVKQALGVG